MNKIKFTYDKFKTVKFRFNVSCLDVILRRYF